MEILSLSEISGIDESLAVFKELYTLFSIC
jgi:hypothetical protein